MGFALIGLISEAKSQEYRPLGIWKDFFPYERVEEVATADGVVYARTEYAVFSYHNETKEIIRHSIVQGISGSNPSAIAVVPISTNEGHVLVIGYEDGNVDLLIDGVVYNMSAVSYTHLTLPTIYSV